MRRKRRDAGADAIDRERVTWPGEIRSREGSMKQRIGALLSVGGLTVLLVGCGALQQTATVAVHPSRLSCDLLPQLVDGNLETAGALHIEGYVERQTGPNRRSPTLRHFVNTKQIVGGQRADAIIKLDTLTYVTDVEIYAESAVSEVLIEVAANMPDDAEKITFGRIKDRQLRRPIRSGQLKRFRIGQKIRYLRISALSTQDTARAEKSGSLDLTTTRTPLKGPTIREVKFYEIPVKGEGD